MIAAIALSPQAPVLVTVLAGSAATEVAQLRAAALAAAGTLPDRWIAVGVGPADLTVEPETSGSFAGYGSDVVVSLASEASPAVVALPLPALFAGWLRGQANPGARVQVRVCAGGLDCAAALARGAALCAEIDTAGEPIGVLVLADGANTLTASAPGGCNPAAQRLQAGLDDALAAGDAAALTRLPHGIVGRVAYQVLAGLAPQPSAATEFIRAAPYGVGYFVGTWTP